MVSDEMNEKLTFKDKACKSSRKNGKHKKKKYWNDELTKLWQNVRNNEKLYLQCKCDKEKKILRQLYKESRKEFDKQVRQAERQYKARHRDYITNIQTDNPNNSGMK